MGGGEAVLDASFNRSFVRETRFARYEHQAALTKTHLRVTTGSSVRCEYRREQSSREENHRVKRFLHSASGPDDISPSSGYVREKELLSVGRLPYSHWSVSKLPDRLRVAETRFVMRHVQPHNLRQHKVAANQAPQPP